MLRQQASKLATLYALRAHLTACCSLSSSTAAASPHTMAPVNKNEFSEVVIALGSNQGNRVDNLLDGLVALANHAVKVLRVSLLYETAPMYVSEQAPFLNAAVLGHTDLPPLQLLYHLKQIEKQAGRDLLTGLRHGPRPLDLDIIFYGSQDMQHEALNIPHVRWQERNFVKAPLADLLLPEDIQRGYIVEHKPHTSALDKLLQAVQVWEAEAGEAQVGQPGLCRVFPIHRQIWELGHSTHICGILNITPDSFSDGGKHVPAAAAHYTNTTHGVVHSQIVDSPPLVQQQQQQQRQESPQAAAPAITDAGDSSSSRTEATSQPDTTAAAAAAAVTPSSSSSSYPANVTGSLGVDVAGAVEAARAMSRAGATLVDVGGQSTRPGSQRLSAEQELARVMPVIRALREDSELVHIPVSIDTYHARVAEEAIAAGADMVNDVTGGLHDPAMFSTVSRLVVPYCLMHMRGDLATMTQSQYTTYSCIWQDVGEALKYRAQLAVEAGILPWNLMLDPGLGFAKTSEGNAELLGHLQSMRREALRGVWGRMPLLVGPSRKRFIGKLTGRHVPAERDLGTAAACVAAVAQGADIVRVHNVPMIAEALAVADGVFRGTWPLLDP